jgi:HlyD family secretion protein
VDAGRLVQRMTPGKDRRMTLRLVALAAIVVALITALVASQRRETPLVVSGFIEADEVRLGSRVGGRVAAVLVEEGTTVAAGQKLVELEPFDLRERETQFQAELERTRREYEKLKAGYRTEEKAQAEARVAQLAAHLLKLRNGPRPQEIKAAEAGVALAQAGYDLAVVDYRRTSNLQEQNAATQERQDVAVKELKAAEALLAERSEQLNLLQAGTRPEEIAEAEAQLDEAQQALQLIENGYRSEDVAQAKAAMDAADAALRGVQSQLAELTITAPVAGAVEAIDLQPGDLVGANAPVVALLDHSTLWVRAYVPENRLNIKLGQKVPVSVDSYPGENFPAEITFISRQAEFTPQNVQTPEERSKQVFRIKATLRDGLDRLRPGMSADVHLEE